MKTKAVPVRQYPEVRAYMTPTPHTIAPNQTLAVAQQMMRHHQIRHLPVLEGGHIVGVVSQRDLLLIESLPGVDPDKVLVEEAMVEDVFTVPPDAAIGETIETLIKRKLGSAIVVDDGHAVGVFTTIDALQALHDLLERP